MALTHNDLVDWTHLHDVLELLIHVPQSKLTYVHLYIITCKPGSISAVFENNHNQVTHLRSAITLV